MFALVVKNETEKREYKLLQFLNISNVTSTKCHKF